VLGQEGLNKQRNHQPTNAKFISLAKLYHSDVLCNSTNETDAIDKIHRLNSSNA
jgi:hypothetical protein